MSKGTTLPTPTGYQANLGFWAEKYRQEDFEFISIKLPVDTIVNGIIQKPDPDKPAAHNRRMTKAHAVAFGDYVRKMKKPFIPPLFVWATGDEISFEADGRVNADDLDVDFGVAKLARTAQLRILDGQHRTYGLYDVVEKLRADIDKQQSQLQAVERIQPELAPEVRNKVKKLKKDRDRILRMVVETTVAVLSGPDDATQIFVDVADNQKGMNPTVTAGFDRRKVYNRVAGDLCENEDILVGVIDFERPRPGKGAWATLNDVAGVCQTLGFGLGGRWSQPKEDEIDEDVLRRRCANYYDDLVTAFPDLNAVLVSRDTAPESLRVSETASLLGSMTMIRVLASVWAELQAGTRGKEAGYERLGRTEVVKFFRSLPMSAGEDEVGARRLSDHWVQSGLFRTPWAAPPARQGDLRKLTNFILDWAREGSAPQVVSVEDAEAQVA